MKLYELRGKDPKYLWSSNPWKSRICLNLKGIKFDSIPLTYPEIHALLPSVLNKEEGCTVPVLVDGECVIQDSFEIAKYLDQKYPEPSIFQGNQALHQFFYDWFDLEVKRPLFKLVILDIASKLDDESKEYYIQKNTKLFGELHAASQDNREQNIQRVQTNLSLLFKHLDTNSFISGETIGWADITTAAFLYMILLANRAVFQEAIAQIDNRSFEKWWDDMQVLIK